MSLSGAAPLRASGAACPRIRASFHHRRQASMANTIYTAEAHVTGGRADGHGRTSDGVLEVDLRLPEEMGGEGGGTNPEQLFAVGYAACFEGALGAVARRGKAEVGDVAIDSKVNLEANDDRTFGISVTL